MRIARSSLTGLVPVEGQEDPMVNERRFRADLERQLEAARDRIDRLEARLNAVEDRLP